MAEHSKIEWTHATFNPWIGCAKVADGCAHCYAEAFAKRTGQASVQFGSVNSVALRAEQSDEWPPPVVGYQLTCFAIGGDWSQLSFDTRGTLLSEIFGPPSAPPTIAQSREVF